MSAITGFHFEGAPVRTVVLDGEPWFVAKDACDVLGITKYRDATAQLDSDERASAAVDTLGGRQQMAIVSEAGLFALMLISRSPKVREFRRWVTHEVLPSIRRTGAYIVPETPEQLMARAVVQAQEIIARKDEQIAVLAPMAEAWEEIADAGTDYAVRDVAPMLSRAGIETGPQRLFDTLHELGWIYRGEKGRWAPYARAVDAGLLKLRAMAPYRDRDTGDLVPSAPQVRITPKGVERLRIRLGAGALTH